MPAPAAACHESCFAEVAPSGGAIRSKPATAHPLAVVKLDRADAALETVGQNGSPFAVTVQKYLVAGARDGLNVVSVTSLAITRTGGDTVSTRTS